MDRVEKVARAVCIAGGYAPDEIMPNDGPRWRYYVPGAEAAIIALDATPPETDLWQMLQNVYADLASKQTSLDPDILAILNQVPLEEEPATPPETPDFRFPSLLRQVPLVSAPDTDRQRLPAVHGNGHTMPTANEMRLAAQVVELTAQVKRAGDERQAAIVGVIRDFASKQDCRGCPNMEPNVSLNQVADWIESGEWRR